MIIRSIFVLLVIASTLRAQEISWTDISASMSLPKGVKLYKGTRATPSLQAWVVDVDLNEKSIALRPFLQDPAILPNQVSKAKAFLGINGGFFSGSTSLSTVIDLAMIKSKNVTSLVRNGANYPVIRSMFSLDKDFKPSIDWIYHFGDGIGDLYKFDSPLPYVSNDLMPQPAPSKNSGKLMPNVFLGIGGAPILVMDGVGSISYDQEIMWGSGVGLSNRDPRTAVGYTKDNHVILLVADGRSTISEGMSLFEVANEMVTFKCDRAMNLDGGGSSGLADGSGYINRPSEQRVLPTILAIVPRDSIPQDKRPTYDEVIDTENPKAKRTGTWSESANAGFYGDSRSLISSKGSGSNEVSYNFMPPKNAICEVYAWWVAAPNRGKDTPYTIVHKGGSTRVGMDQTANGSQWNLLGKFTFKGDGTDIIKINNDATLGDFVVADALRLVSFGEFDTTSSTNNLENNDVYLYPNPSYDLLWIKSSNSAIDRAYIVDSYGKKINIGMTSPSDLFHIDIKDLQKGIYYVIVQSNQNSVMKKFIKL